MNISFRDCVPLGYRCAVRESRESQPMSYPFGLKHKGDNPNINGIDYKYGFGGKEEQEELGLTWLDFHARNYDASLGRWMNIDNASEEYYDFTPYSYVANSPIIANDPTGERIIIVGDSEYRGAVLFQLILSARSKAGFKRLVNAIESKDNLVIQMGDGVNGISDRRKNDDGTSTQFLNFNPFNSEQQDDVNSVPSETLVHEIDHFLNKDPKKHLPFYNGRYIEDSNTGTSYPDSFPRSEFPAVRAQNEHRATFGKKVRRNYDGVDIFNKEPSDKRGDKLVPSSKPFNKKLNIRF